MTGFLLGLCFAGGVALVWLGLFSDVRMPSGSGRLGAIVAGAGVAIGPAQLVLLAVVVGVSCGLVAQELVGVPALALTAAAGGAWAPFAWLGRRAARRGHERERAWPAVLSQLADGLDAGIAFPAAVALAAESGPTALRGDLAAFQTRLRAGGLQAALDGLARAGERTADTVVLFLRAGLLDLPAGGLAPVLRELAATLSERFEAREKARSRASSLQIEATILALSPIALLLLVGLSSPAYLDAYKTAAGTAVGVLGGAMIFGCYVLMRRLGRIPEPARTGGQK